MNIQNIEQLIEEFKNPEMLNLGEIIRYNNRFKIKNENVAEHSFYVSVIALRLCQIFNIDDKTKLEVLKMSIVHDIPEKNLGDIPYDTKLHNPELAEILELAEINEIKRVNSDLAPIYIDFINAEKENSVSFLIVKLSDTISVLQYTNLELQLGNNTAGMIEIYNDAIIRVRKMFEKLQLKIDENNKIKSENDIPAQLIMIEGVDRSGKDSLWREINKQGNYKHTIMDRGPIGSFTYALINGRLKHTSQYIKHAKMMSMNENALVIYLDCDTDTLIERCQETNHEILDFDYHKAMYEKTLENSHIKNIVKVDTTVKTTEEIVKELFEKGIL